MLVARVRPTTAASTARKTIYSRRRRRRRRALGALSGLPRRPAGVALVRITATPSPRGLAEGRNNIVVRR